MREIPRAARRPTVTGPTTGWPMCLPPMSIAIAIADLPRFSTQL